MISREDKSKIIDDIKSNLTKSNAMFLTNIIGMSSNDIVQLRKQIRGAKGRILVARNTLFVKAAQGTQHENSFKDLKGPSALAVSFGEANALAKVLYDAGKEFEPITFKAGHMDGRAITAQEFEILAKLPSRDQMLGTLLATFNAPISAFARVLDALKKKREEEAVSV